jgi:Cu-Zn family superoxide dismutase
MQKTKWFVRTVLPLAALFLLACPPAEEAAEPAAAEPAAAAEPTAAEPAAAEPAAEVVAMAELQSRADMAIRGTVILTATAEGVHVTADVSGVAPGRHGFHVHELGDCSAADFTSAGGHFNPASHDHAGPDAPTSHAGDLGNIEVGEDGSGHLELTSTALTLDDGPNSALGRGVVLHEGEDDLTSQPTGAAGGRLGCGVIALLGDEG